MSTENLRIPKQLSEVRLWIHPEGQVVASLFLSFTGEDMRPEDPLQVLNTDSRFLAIKREDPDEVRFYNKASIVRVEYLEEVIEDAQIKDPLQCTMHMMDGSLIDGEIHRFLPPEHSRLYDYLNLDNEPFTKIHLQEGYVCLINKAYIVRVSPK